MWGHSNEVPERLTLKTQHVNCDHCYASFQNLRGRIFLSSNYLFVVHQKISCAKVSEEREMLLPRNQCFDICFFQKCKSILNFLFKLGRKIWKCQNIPSDWRLLSLRCCQNLMIPHKYLNFAQLLLPALLKR